MKLLKLLALALLANLGMQAQELVAGQATLTKLQDGIYEIKKENGSVKTIDIRPNVEEHLQGKLSVFFNDCEKVRQSVFDLREITESILVKTVKEYNNCDYKPFEPTEKEVIQAANFLGDEYKFFAGIGASLNRSSFFDLKDYENLTQAQLSFGLAATPGFLGSLQGNLYFTLEINAAFSGNKDFSNAPFYANFKTNSYKGSVGTEYHFNKNGTIQPLIGVGFGLVRDYYNGTYDNYKIKKTVGSGFWNPKVGLLYSLDNKKSLGFIVSYIPEYKNDLSFMSDGELVPLEIHTHYINAGLYLYF